MTVITISRQYASGGDEIARQLCDRLGYRFLDKDLMASLGAQAGSVALVQNFIRATHGQGGAVILGRGGQVALRDMPDVLHVRVVAPLEIRIRRVQEQRRIDCRRGARTSECERPGLGRLRQALLQRRPGRSFALRLGDQHKQDHTSGRGRPGHPGDGLFAGPGLAGAIRLGDLSGAATRLPPYSRRLRNGLLSKPQPSIAFIHLHPHRKAHHYDVALLKLRTRRKHHPPRVAPLCRRASLDLLAMPADPDP